MRKTVMTAQLLSGSALAKFFVVFVRRFGDAVGIQPMIASPAKQNSRCAQKTCREAWPIITSGRIASGFTTDWNLIGSTVMAAKLMIRTIPRCYSSTETWKIPS
jgi:hypothetical protein